MEKVFSLPAGRVLIGLAKYQAIQILAHLKEGAQVKDESIWFSQILGVNNAPELRSVIDANEIQVLRGKLRKTKKGELIFDATLQEKPHLLIKADWGGAFSRTGGGLKVEREEGDAKRFHILFEKQRCSNGGGMGTYWYVIDIPIEEFIQLLQQKKLEELQ